MTHEKFKVLIVDDDRLALQTLTRYFSMVNDFVVAATATNGYLALEALQHHTVDVILADVHMPRMNGLTLLDEVVKLPDPPVFIAITALDNDETMLRVLGQGGSGYILKSQTPASVIQAVRDAVAGGMVVSPNAVRGLINEIPRIRGELSDDHTLLEKVTSESSTLPRVEKDVLTLLCKGMSNAEIAAKMMYSESSIKKRVSKLIRDFGANSRLDLVVALLNREDRT
ncbi:MAG: response regulator transcription factor [Corynebacterium sp.]|nr:response regulator transcription factor [Corynebacterium sp.]